MEVYKIVGTLGACILAAGVFAPARLTTMVGYISYFSDHQTNALILIALAMIALLLVFYGSPGRLMTFGVFTLAAVAWAYMRRTPGLRLIEGNVGDLAAQAISFPALQHMSDSMVTNTPWWLMLAGSALLVIAGLLQTKRV
jgi:hypothetical protein